MSQQFHVKQFVIITLITSIWINLSEVFRYFLFVMPDTQAYFPERDNVAIMNLGIFVIWGLWDTILTGVMVFVFWLTTRTFGNNYKTILISATCVWISVFVIFWIASANMGLSDWNILPITLPLSWIEMAIGTFIASFLYKRIYTSNNGSLLKFTGVV